ncbi:DUF134 domain-containing protein [candidate division KSB1 bacterium]
MVRPRNCRIVSGKPAQNYFKPAGIPVSQMEVVNLTMDEFEAVRLADLESLYQENAAEKMNVSRQTFGRIIESAHHKIAEVIVFGKALKIEGGDYKMADIRQFKCFNCNHVWELPFGGGRPGECPACKNVNFHRIDSGAGIGSGSGRKGSPDKGRARRCGIKLEEKQSTVKKLENEQQEK